tara:strand:+ start:2682 stop:2864 length:183 start_codon:yes stop_codon:yes gene_type:complete
MNILGGGISFSLMCALTGAGIVLTTIRYFRDQTKLGLANLCVIVTLFLLVVNSHARFFTH